MPLESATYISDLVSSNPAASDGMNNADDHMRLTKAAVKATFPNFTAAALVSTQAQIDGAVSSVLGTAYTRFMAGTAALPGITPVGDPNTGLYAYGADQLGVSTNGALSFYFGTTHNQSVLPLLTASVANSGSYSGGTGQLVPIGGTLIWWDDVLPAEGGYAWANGQIIASANTVCPVLLARWGTRFGGNGLTTMGVPDLRDTVPVGKSTMGAVASRALHTLTNTVLGALLGLANTVLTTANLPAYTPSGTVNSVLGGTFTKGINQNGASTPPATLIGGTASGGQVGDISVSSTFAGNPQGGTSAAVNNVQPSTTCNYIIRLA